ncbi:MAG: GAF domain-containing protein, partial [Chloroflexales bacterium]|nr:GAF domain-containing protein [Chloroflexales bacterium]
MSNDTLILWYDPIWLRCTSYGLIVLGVVYWALARAYLQLPWHTPWGWVVALLGLALTISLDLRWVVLPTEIFNLSAGWVHMHNVMFVSGTAWWGLLMAATVLMTGIHQVQTQSPAYRNRISHLLVATVLLSIGYGGYLWFREPFWTLGLVTTVCAGIFLVYMIVVEDLIDLGTAIRMGIRTVVLVVVTVAVYLTGIYVVQAFLSVPLDNLFLVRVTTDHTLIIAGFTAVLLTIVYTPIRKLSRRMADRILFGRHYEYTAVVQHYTQSISNLLDPHDLAHTAFQHINEALALNHGTLFLVEFDDGECLALRPLTQNSSNGAFQPIALLRDAPVWRRFVQERRPLAQYAVDVSLQFKDVTPSERQALQSLHCEWYFPILKGEQLLGLFALGPKMSGQAYTAQDKRLLNTLADQIAMALENATLFDRLQRNLEETTRLKHLMDNVFDSVDSGVITINLKGCITFYNRAAESLLAAPPEQTLGTPYIEALPFFENTTLPNLMENVTSREDHYADYEMVLELPGRGRTNLSLDLTPFKDAKNQTQGVTILINDTTETKRLRAAQNMFRRYVSPAVVDRLPADPADLKLGGTRQEVTILFADIRGFTTLGEKLPPEALVDMLNQYLSLAASSILMYEGTLDKFMGDAVMGIFNAPLEQPDHVLRAVRAALALQQSIVDYSRYVGDERKLCFGVGIHTGEAVVGNVGMSDRMDYTAIGDTVNLAKRLQENTPGGKVLVSEGVYRLVADHIEGVFYKTLSVKGREQSVDTYELRMCI